jgi:hypothetical protein
MGVLLAWAFVFAVALLAQISNSSSTRTWITTATAWTGR